jgi:hypothetical protein
MKQEERLSCEEEVIVSKTSEIKMSTPICLDAESTETSDFMNHPRDLCKVDEGAN